KFFLDALPMAETEGPVDMMVTLIKNKDVEGILAKTWITSLALIQNPSSSMIDAALDLLESPFYDDAVLPVSSLVNNYCKKDANCGGQTGVVEVVKKLTNNIPRRCYITEKNAGDVMKTLRALGNTGRSGIVSSALITCLQSSSTPVEIRAASADAFRHVPCGDKNQNDNQLWNILKNQGEAFELRIFSYLAVMRCPSKDNLDKVTELLENEKDEQVGSYITSHLSNLKQTSDPHKQDIADAVRKLSYKEFGLSALKFSKNFEASFLINKLNLGLVADSDVISSPDSSLPRFAKANLTVELFGNSINIFEMGGRIEGMEFLVEKLIGPNGYFSTGAKDKTTDQLKGFAYARLFGNELFFQRFSGVEGLMKSRKVPNFLDYLIQLADRQAVAYSYSAQLMDVALVVPTIAGLPLNISVNGSINFDLKAEGKADLRQVAASPRSLDIDGEFRPSAALEVTGTMAVDALVANLGLRMRNTMHSSTGIKGRIHINRGRELSVEIEPPKDQMEIFNAKSQFFIVHNDVEKEQGMVKTNRKEYKWCTGETVAKVLGTEFCGEVRFPNASSFPDAPYFPLTGPAEVNFVSYRRDTHSVYKLIAKRTESKDKSTAHFLVDTPGSKVNRKISTDVGIGYSPKQLDVIVNSPWRKMNINGGVVANKDLYSLVGSILLDDMDKYGFSTEMKMSRKGNNAVYTPLVQTTYKGNTQDLISGRIELDADGLNVPNKFQVDLKIQGYKGAPCNFKCDLINNNKEKRLTTNLSYGNKDPYVLNIGTLISGRDRNIQISPELTIKTPEAVLFSLIGSGDYKADKSLSGNLTLNVMKQKPATFSLSMADGFWGKIDMKLKSAPVTGDVKIDNNLKKNQKTSQIRVNYNIPSLGVKDSFKVDSKYQDKSQKSFSKYALSSKLNHQKYSDYNLDLSLNVDHKDKRSIADSIIKYGADPTNKKKVINLNYNFKMDSFGAENADFDLQVAVQVPEKKVNSVVKVAHSHTQNELESNMKLKLIPYLKNDVSASVNLKNNKQKLTKFEGKADLEYSGQKYVFNTDLTQKSKSQYVSNADFSSTTGTRHSMATVYNMKDASSYEVTSDLNLDGYDPIKLRGNVSLGASNYGTSLNLLYGTDEYGATVQTKYIENRFGKLNLLLVHPDRQIQAAGEAKIAKDKYDVSASVNWDAANKNSKQEVSVDGTFKADSAAVSGDVKIKTPFDRYEEVNSKVVYTTDGKQMKSTARLTWGKGQQRKVSSTMSVSYPVTVQNVKVGLNVETSFNSLKEMNIDIDHSLDTGLSTTVNGKINNNKGELIITGENRGDSYKNDVSASVSLKTTMPNVKDVSVVVSHSDDATNYKTAGTLSYNGNKYESGLTMYHSLKGFSVSNNGNLKVSWPKDSVEATWKHENTDARSVKCNLKTTWSGKSKTVMISLDGSNYLGRGNRLVKGNLNIQTPFEEVQMMKVVINHQHDAKRLSHNFDIDLNNEDYAAYEYLLETETRSINSKVSVKLPFLDLIHGQTTVKYDKFPSTSSVWLEWSPYQRIDFDGSLNAPSIDNIELDTKLSTPFRNFENVLVKASHQLNDEEYVSSVLIDYNVRKRIELTNKFQSDNSLIAWRTTLTSPCRYFRSLNYGLRVELDDDSFDGTADFELLPHIKKYDSLLQWSVQSEGYDGKFVLNTPHKNLPSLQITSWRKVQDDGSKAAHIDVSTSPNFKYVYDVTYKSEAPYLLDMQVKTPHVNYQDMGLTMTHSPVSGAVQSKLELVYLSKKEIVVDLDLDWNNKFDGNLVVSTPVRDYRTNSISIKHQATRQGFMCNLEANMGVNKLKGDASFSRTNSLISGSANLALPQVRKIETKFKLTGSLTDLKGDALVKVGSDAVSVGFTNNVNSGSCKSTFNLKTPVTEDFQVEITHDDKSSRTEKKFDCSFKGQYGDKDLTSQLSVSCSGLKNGQFDYSLKTPFDGYESLNVNLVHEITAEKIYGKFTVQSTAASIGNIDVTINKQGTSQDWTASTVMRRNRDQLVDVALESKWRDNDVQGKVNAKGKWLPTVTSMLNYKGTYSNFNIKTRLAVNNNLVVNNELVAKVDGQMFDVTGTINYNEGSGDLKHIISINKIGDLNNLKLVISHKSNEKESKVNFELQTDGKFKSLIHIENLAGELDYIGYEIEHSGDLDKFLTNIKVYISKESIIESRTNFFKYGDKRVEFSSELSTPFDGYRSSKIEYRHEGQDNRVSCNINLKYGNNKVFSSDLIMQREPTMSFSFNIKTPFPGYEQLLLSSDYDAKRIDGRVLLGGGIDIRVSAIPGSQYQLLTSFDNLKQVTVNLDGEPLDGKADFLVLSNGKKITGNANVIYTSADSLSVSASLDSDIENMEAFKFIVKNDNDGTRGKSSHIEFSWDPEHQVVIDGKYSNKNSARSRKEHELQLDITLPYDKLSQINVDFSHSYVDRRMMSSKFALEFNKEKVVDVDVSYKMDNEQKTSVVVRKPWPQEYAVTLDVEGDEKAIDIALNWNKDLPTSNIRIKNSITDSATDKKVNMEVTYKNRKVGMEQSYLNSVDALSNSGKFFWDDKDDAKVTYSMDVKGGKSDYNGEFKLGLPTRSLVLKGFSSRVGDTQKVEATFGWDMDKDETKVIGLTATVFSRDFTKADLTVKLPSDLQMNSAVTFNQGSVIFDSQTDFSYAGDSRKILTLFSSVKNNPYTLRRYFAGSENAYNYSVEFGVKHPETKVDIKVDSHLGKSANLMTSSMGVRYMTSTRQIKNLALFAEINELKKEMNLVASTPFNSLGLNGKIIDDEPLNLELSASVNGQQSFKSALDTSNRAVNVNFGQPGNMYRFNAMYSDASSVKVELEQLNDNDKKADAALSLTLVKPRILQSSFIWKPRAVSDLRTWLIQQIVRRTADLKVFIRQLDSDVKTELVAKNRDIRNYLIDSLKQVTSNVESELKSLSVSMDQLQQTLSTLRRASEIYTPLQNSIKYIQTEYQQLIRSYRTLSSYTINLVMSKLDEVNHYSVDKVYEETVTDLIESGLRALDEMTRTFTRLLRKDIDLSVLQPISDELTKAAQYLTTQFTNIQKNIIQFNLGDILTKKLSFLNDYRKAVQNIQRNTINKVVPVELREGLQYVFSEIINQVDYLSRYLEIEENLKKHVNFAVHLVNDIVVDELKEFVGDVKEMLKDPVVAYDPENGLITLNIPLPIAVGRLDRMPEISNNVRSLIQKYAPSKDSITSISKYFWNSSIDDSTLDTIKSDLDEFEPMTLRIPPIAGIEVY
ncbi:hypothetical protein Btru_040086, partial [Bulinus truncatus]